MYKPNDFRYDKMIYRRCAGSGLKLPAISLGLWQNFGKGSDFENAEEMCHTAFDLGITHFDLANNYGMPYNGTAEENFGKILDRGLRPYRDELCISTKAGFEMWPGPYGDRNGSRKYLISSLDQSLKRMNLDYVDVFYHHVSDPETPLEETANALDSIVRAGKALYVGVSNYNRERTAQIHAIFKELRTPFILNQPSYSMLYRWVEDDGLDEYCLANDLSFAVYSPLYQGLLTDRYLNGIPQDSRAARGNTSIASKITPEIVEKLRRLNDLAGQRGQKLSQMAVAWLLNKKPVATVLCGASRPEQIRDNVKAIENMEFSAEELAIIDEILA